MAKGSVAIRMTNDYLFHALFQEDNEALKGFVCALLKLDAGQVKSAVVINPIELGTSVGDKEFILDIKVLLDDRAIINLELQVINQHNWPERSLSYLCRAFDNLNPGEGCQRVKPVVHIGLLDFTLFPKFPEFYATHRLMNVKNHMIYSDKLQLSLVDLTHIDLATEEDMQHRIDCWAAFFKAATWEEIEMIAQRDENIAKAANTVWKLSQEDKIRLQCEAREDYYRNRKCRQEKAFFSCRPKGLAMITIYWWESAAFCSRHAFRHPGHVMVFLLLISGWVTFSGVPVQL